MLTCKSPRKVMLVAHHLASGVLPAYTSRFSRKDFTLPQLFACLVIKEMQKRSFREAEALLRDAEHWCRAIGMSKVPDHNTLCRAAAAAVLLRRCKVGKLLDALTRFAATARLLGLSTRPLAGDSSTFERHHVSGHFAERRRRESRRARERRMRGKPRNPARALRRLPKLAVAVASRSHLIVGAWCGTGAGCDARPTSRRCCSTPGVACPTAASPSCSTPATTARTTTGSRDTTWACGRSCPR